eukprot:CAMPEP_0173191096 /NCGR_PEP_ID=MMETSP1141-20130122/12702_1 /TAXON_ID=483371 /ORGANISM="non described non described, Strain CCMP2298" /LENGTH=64 /DNA_ID=CAMNT_0014115261 /DNA_START=262 /DNA_END=456 /DNA_ORIENTATION=+
MPRPSVLEEVSAAAGQKAPQLKQKAVQLLQVQESEAPVLPQTQLRASTRIRPRLVREVGKREQG